MKGTAKEILGVLKSFRSHEKYGFTKTGSSDVLSTNPHMHLLKSFPGVVRN